MNHTAIAAAVLVSALITLALRAFPFLLARIARRYDLPPGTVAGWNKTSATASLKAGQSITLYLPMRAGKPKAAPRSKASARRAAAAQAGKGRVKVTVAPGKAKAGADKAPAKAPAGKASAAKTKAAAPAKAKAKK